MNRTSASVASDGAWNVSSYRWYSPCSIVTEGSQQWAGTDPDWLDAGVEMQWDIAGAAATRRQLEATGLTIENEWPLQDVLVEGESWVVFDARLLE